MTIEVFFSGFLKYLKKCFPVPLYIKQKYGNCENNCPYLKESMPPLAQSILSGKFNKAVRHTIACGGRQSDG